MQETITVNGPDDEINLHNPLYSYWWQTYPLNKTQFPGYGGMGPVTTRHRGENDVSKFIKDSQYRTFSSATTYDEMASMAGSGIDCLPCGHVPSYYIIGQTLHDPGAPLTPKGEIIIMDGSLKPFYQSSFILCVLFEHPIITKADGRTFHTGRTVATTEAFGYTYPDMPGDDQINNLYGGLSATENWASASASRREWFAEIQVDRADLPLPCVPERPTCWPNLTP
ncbi:hypothetical protein EV127DRAFT_506325 [Xylaria flabelliformis]|nr:hypothetical protein EV127DRAFT_506325 [Xylaria flabelliformis]